MGISWTTLYNIQCLKIKKLCLPKQWEIKFDTEPVVRPAKPPVSIPYPTRKRCDDDNAEISGWFYRGSGAKGVVVRKAKRQQAGYEYVSVTKDTALRSRVSPVNGFMPAHTVHPSDVQTRLIRPYDESSACFFTRFDHAAKVEYNVEDFI